MTPEERAALLAILDKPPIWIGTIAEKLVGLDPRMLKELLADIRAEEREACAQTLDEAARQCLMDPNSTPNEVRNLKQAAAAIRARP